MNKDQREQSRVICEAATPGEWTVNDLDDCFIEPKICDMPGYRKNTANASFITHARTALPAALDALDAMEEKANRHVCAYCERIFVGGTSAEALRRHIYECSKHPLTALRAERDHYKARCAALEAEKEQLRAGWEWIPTEHETPAKIGERVLVYPIDGCMEVATYLGEGVYRMGDYAISGEDFTDWMPIPESPKEA